MSHPLVLGLFTSAERAALAARALHASGISRESISVVARTHDEALTLAKALDATAGVEIEDSRPAARLGEIGAIVLAATALALPGGAPFVAPGALSAELGEAAGHLGGSLAAMLTKSGIAADVADSWEAAVAAGQVILGVHLAEPDGGALEHLLREHGAAAVGRANWDGALPSASQPTR